MLIPLVGEDFFFSPFLLQMQDLLETQVVGTVNTLSEASLTVSVLKVSGLTCPAAKGSL